MVAAATPTDRLQAGIYFRRTQRPPPPAFALILFRVNSRIVRTRRTQRIQKLLAQLWAMYEKLNSGIVPDIGPDYPVPNDHPMGVLFGYGADAFKLPGSEPLPFVLGRADFEPPDFGGTLAMFQARTLNGSPKASGIHYARGGLAPRADFAVQLTGPTPFRVERAIVETWKQLHDFAPGPAPLEVAGVFTGNQRDDRRSWLDFHDGISNLTEHQREQVIVIPDTGLKSDDLWTAGGTYLGFIRIGIDLGAWRKLNTYHQQRMVGREKLDGCPIVAFPAPQVATPIAGCTPETVLQPRPPRTFRDPGPLLDSDPDPVVMQSHIRRANQRRSTPPAETESFRIYRQGYQFLEPSPRQPTAFERRSGFRAGLNFVSFQNDPERLIGILATDGWLGAENFGGQTRAQPGSVNPLTAYAAGMFLVPPKVDGEPFPGATALGA